MWSETEYSSFGIAIVTDRVVGGVNVCTLEGPASYVVLFCLWARVGAASGVVNR